MAVSNVNANQRIPLPEPAWYQTEKAAKIGGVALIVIGAIGAIISAAAIVGGAMGLPVGGVAAIIGGSVGLAASIASIATGIFLVRKECWNDPAFMDKIAEKAKNMTFDEIIKAYGKEKTEQFHFISKADYTKKLLQKAANENLSYTEIISKFGRRFVGSDLRPLLMKQIASEGWTVRKLKEVMGSQPLEDKVLDYRDPWIVENIQRELQGLSFQEMVSGFGTYLNKSDTINELQRQYEGMTFADFYQKHQSHFYQIIGEGVLPAYYFSEKASQETEQTAVSEIIQRFGWGVFACSILKSEHYAPRFAQEIAPLNLSQVLHRYGWDGLANELTTKEVLRTKALAEIQGMSFDEMIQRFGWEVFERQVLLGSDPQVSFAYKAKAQQLNFIDFWAQQAKAVEKYHLFNQGLLQLAKTLWNNLLGAQATYTTQLTANQQVYDATLRTESGRASAAQAAARLEVDAALTAYNVERIRHKLSPIAYGRHAPIQRDLRRIIHIANTLILEDRYWSAVERYHQVLADSERAYSQAAAAAAAHKSTQDALASANLNGSKMQINQTFAAALV